MYMLGLFLPEVAGEDTENLKASLMYFTECKQYFYSSLYTLISHKMTANKLRTQTDSYFHNLSISECKVDDGDACRPGHDASDLSITSPNDSFRKKSPTIHNVPLAQ